MDASQALKAKWLKVGRKDNLRVMVLGCGGTGSKLVPEICQAMVLFAENIEATRIDRGRYYGTTKQSLLLVDHDIVEENNLTRQHFVRGDLGKNKARVLAQRYAMAFGMAIGCHDGIVDTPDDLAKLLFQLDKPTDRGNTYSSTHVLFTCVDNHPTRRVVHEFITRLVADPRQWCTHEISSLFWVDLGNEETAGQVSVGFYSHYRDTLPLPFVTEVFPEILEAEPGIRPSQRPCGIGGVQDLNVNAAAAVHAASFFRQLLKCMSIDGGNPTDLANYHLVEFGVLPPTAQVRFNILETMQNYQWITDSRRSRVTRLLGG